jgi:hypothetical protein
VTVREQARIKPGYAWSYRVLDPGCWYTIVPDRSSEIAVVLDTPDGPRVVDASHVEVRSLLE